MKSIGTSIRGFPCASVARKQKICTPVGIATIVEAAENSVSDITGRPVANMWCAQRPKLRKPIVTTAATANP